MGSSFPRCYSLGIPLHQNNRSEMTKAVATILLVEDDVPTRDRFCSVLNEHPALEVVAAVGSVAEAKAVLAQSQPQVLLTDLGLPDGSGIELIHELYQRECSTETMVISVFGDERHIIGALEAGATGYILKDGSSDYICKSVIQLLEGGSPISAPIARVILKRFKHPPLPHPPPPDAPDLTSREKDVLAQLAKGYSYSEIADVLGISGHTVTSHVKHIYRKLAVRSRSEAVFEAVQLGLISLGPQT